MSVSDVKPKAAKATSKAHKPLVAVPGVIPLAHSPEAAAQRLGSNRRAIYRAIAEGSLRSFKFGRRRLIMETELQRFLSRRMKEAA